MRRLIREPYEIRQVSLLPARRLLFALSLLSRGDFWLGVIKVRMVKAIVGRIIGPSPAKRVGRAASSIQSVRFTECLHQDSENNKSDQDQNRGETQENFNSVHFTKPPFRLCSRKAKARVLRGLSKRFLDLKLCIQTQFFKIEAYPC